MSDVLSMAFLLRALHRGPVGSLDAGRGGLAAVSLQIFVKSERPSSMIIRGAHDQLIMLAFFSAESPVAELIGDRHLSSPLGCDALSAAVLCIRSTQVSGFPGNRCTTATHS